MNATQRKFLIEKIQEKTKARIEILKQKLEKLPNIDNFIFKAILNDNLKIRSETDILDALKKKALKAKAGDAWLSGESIGFFRHRGIMLMVDELVELPQDYFDELERVKTYNKCLEDEIANLRMALDTIEIRIQLSSDSTLQKLINDVDDMGDIKLIDTNLKMLIENK